MTGSSHATPTTPGQQPPLPPSQLQQPQQLQQYAAANGPSQMRGSPNSLHSMPRPTSGTLGYHQTLHHAIESGDKALFDRLISEQTNDERRRKLLNQRLEGDYRPIHAAAKSKDPYYMQRLMAEGQQHLKYRPDAQGNYPLYLAATNQQDVNRDIFGHLNDNMRMFGDEWQAMSNNQLAQQKFREYATNRIEQNQQSQANAQQTATILAELLSRGYTREQIARVAPQLEAISRGEFRP